MSKFGYRARLDRIGTEGKRKRIIKFMKEDQVSARSQRREPPVQLTPIDVPTSSNTTCFHSPTFQAQKK